MKTSFKHPENYISETRVYKNGVSRYRLTCKCTKCGGIYNTSRQSISKRKSTMCSKCSSKAFMTDERKKRISKTLTKLCNTPEAKAKHSQLMVGKMAGAKHWNWKGGISPKNQEQRTSPEYKLWRTSIFSRDGWKCAICPFGDGGTLVAHHIKSWSEYKELRFEVDNGVTVCQACHALIHKYKEIERESTLCLAKQ